MKNSLPVEVGFVANLWVAYNEGLMATVVNGRELVVVAAVAQAVVFVVEDIPVDDDFVDPVEDVPEISKKSKYDADFRNFCQQK